MQVGRKRCHLGGLALLALLGLAPGLAAQDSLPPPDFVPGRDTTFVVDRIVAVVGDRPVLASQVEERLFERQTRGEELPTDSAALAALRRQAIAEIVDEELLVQQAQRDTLIKVTEQEVADGVAEQMRRIRRNFSSEAEYRAELRKAGFQTPDEYRRWLSDQQRRAALQNRLIEQLNVQEKLKPISPTEPEMRAYFEAQKPRLGKRPATLSFQQIVITPEASTEAKERARQLADSIATELRDGADFAAAARRFSGDPGSRERGGELDWFRRGVMVPEFEDVAFRLKPGQISHPVETPFGFHVIQVQRIQPAEIQARHILIVPEIDSVRVDSARALAESVRRAVQAGASFDSLQRRYHDRSAERGAEQVPVDQLPSQYAAMAGADSGTVVPVFELPGTGQRPQFVVARVVERRPEGEVRYEDVKDRLFDQLGRQMAIRRYIDQLKSATYIEVRNSS